MNEMKKKDCGARSLEFSRYLGLELKGAIAASGSNQAKVAKGIGHDAGTLSRWLAAKPPIGTDVAYKVCDYLGVDLSTLVGRAEKRMGGRPDEG